MIISNFDFQLRKLVLACGFVFFLLSKVQTQHIATNNPTSSYLKLSTGFQSTSFRDFATSPLFYNGNMYHFGLAHIDNGLYRSSVFQFTFSSGQLESQRSESNVQILAINYLECFGFLTKSDSRFKVFLGGQLSTSMHLRNNISFGNNGEGYELISNIFGTIIVNWNLSKIRSNLSHKFSLKMNLGLVNTAYRNGFIYTRQSPLLNEDKITDGYAFHLFSGYRIQTDISYNFYLQNGNALTLSYFWDVYSTSSIPDKFQLAGHLLSCAILFKLN